MTSLKEGSIEQHRRDSNHILRRISEAKHSISPFLSGTGSEPQPWQRYLPHQPTPHNYKMALERKLEQLFNEEKEMLRERHLPPSGQHRQRGNNMYPESRGEGRRKEVSSVDKMERKIRQLEEMYRGHPSRESTAMKELEQRGETSPKKQPYHQTSQMLITQEHAHQTNLPSRYDNSSKEQTAQKEAINQASRRKQERIETEVRQLRDAVQQLKQSNGTLIRQLGEKKQRRRHKGRTREILINILSRLGWINLQLRFEGVRKGQNAVRIEGEIHSLLQQVIGLKKDYIRLEAQRRKVDEKQQNIEGRLRGMSQKC